MVYVQAVPISPIVPTETIANCLRFLRQKIYNAGQGIYPDHRRAAHPTFAFCDFGNSRLCLLSGLSSMEIGRTYRFSAFIGWRSQNGRYQRLQNNPGRVQGEL